MLLFEPTWNCQGLFGSFFFGSWLIFNIFAQFINLESIELFWFAVPAVNVLLAMRELLQNEIHLAHIFVWIFSSLIYAACATWYASRQFLREDLVESIS